MATIAAADRQIIPLNGWALTAVELRAWEEITANELSIRWVSIELFKGKYVDRYGVSFPAYLIPADSNSSTWLSGYFAGRRSKARR